MHSAVDGMLVIGGRDRGSWSELLDALPTAALIFDRKLIIRAQNTAHEEMTGSRRRETVGHYMFDAFPPPPGRQSPSAEKAIYESIAQIQRSGQPHTLAIQEHGLKNAQGRWQRHFWRVTQSPILVEGELTAFLQTSEDITHQRLESEHGQAQKLAASAAAALSYFSYDTGTDEFLRAPSVDEAFGFKPHEAGPTARPFFERVYEDDLVEVYAELERIETEPLGTLASFDYRVDVPGREEPNHMRARGAMVIDPADQRRKLVGVFVDMTDTERTRARLEQAITEKDRLLLEVNHRVKNSLQLATSMLRAEARRASDRYLKQILELSNSRIEAIADVHAGLYSGGSVTRIATYPLVELIINSARQSLGAGGKGAQIEWDGDDFELPTDPGIAFALLLNELLTNAVKHGGAPGCRPVRVEIRSVHGQVRLDVSNDDAAGPDTVEDAASGMGRQLINGFVRQLGGEMTRRRAAGRYRVSVIFDPPADTAS
ncbi:MAG: PAS domain-containing protein [Alphaproteobacteria bacterium]|nr:PAS domain-containing protein [Alphaproteobacteria bacterium]